MQIEQAINWAVSQLIDSDSALLDAQVLLAFTLGKETIYLMTWPERELSDLEHAQFNDLIKKRQTGYPVAHLTGQREFWSLPLKVNDSTLIPRPDTEVLVELALEKITEQSQIVNASLLDLGTGTGAIILALASELPNATCLGVDVNEQAVLLAQENAQHLQLNNVTIQQSHWFESVSGQFDVIVSNPPYIDEQDVHLNQGDVRFEPLSALVAKEQGLADIRQITEQAATYLRSGGYIIFEHGFQQANAVQQVLVENGFTHIETKQDYAGNDRVTLGLFKH